MPKFKITFSDVFEADDELDAIDELRAYLRECVEMEDVTAFGFEEMDDEKNAVFTVKDLRDRLNQVGLPFDEVESGSDGVICLAFATDDEEYSDAQNN